MIMKSNGGTWFNWAFFRVKAFKKGTMHFEFLDEKVWMTFNQAVAEQRGWVLQRRERNNCMYREAVRALQPP